MKFNFNDLSKAKKIKDLYKGNKLKFPLNKPLHTQTYLHHVLINLDKIKLLDKEDLPIFLVNSDDLDGIMLAASNQNIIALKYLLIKYNKYIKNTNSTGNNWVHFLEIDSLEKLIFDKDLKSLDWYYLLTLENQENVTTLSYVFENNKKKLINNLLTKFIYDKPNIDNMEHFYNLFNNYIFSTDEIIKILNKLIKKNIVFKKILRLNLPIHYPLLLRESKELLNILYDYKEKKNQGTYGFIPTSQGSHSLYYMYNNQLSKNYIKYFFKKFKNYLNLNEKTLFGDNILISLLAYHANNNFSIKEINNELFKIHNKDDLLHTVSDGKQTILHQLVNIPFKKYKKYHKFLDFKKLNIRDKDGLLPIDYTNDKKWIVKLGKIPEFKFTSKKNDVKLQVKEKTHSTIFKAYIEDIGLYFYFLKNKFPKLYIPNPKIKTLQKNLSYDGLYHPSPMLDIYHEMAWIILYKNKDIYYLHPYLDLLLNGAIKSGKYEYSCLLLSLRNEYGGLHATPIFIDFKNKNVIRWDSFGLSSDSEDIDKIIKLKLADKINFKYIPLKASQSVVGIQERSRENEDQNLKRGDFGGFCLAWSIWFIEHMIINNNKKKIKKLINKLETSINQKDSLVNYIRNYSNYLFESVKIIFKKNNWNIDNYTNEKMDYYLEEDIYNFLFENM